MQDFAKLLLYVMGSMVPTKIERDIDIEGVIFAVKIWKRADGQLGASFCPRKPAAQKPQKKGKDEKRESSSQA